MNSVVAGLVGVVLGGSIGIIKDYIAHRAGRKRRGHYAAVRIVCVLDEYIEGCVEVVGDDGTSMGSPAGRTSSGEEFYEPQVQPPPPPSFANDIDWTSLDPTLMYRILALPNRAKETDRIISGRAEHSYPPYYDEIFDARQEGFTDLGLEALSIADQLRRDFKVAKRMSALGSRESEVRDILETERAAIETRRSEIQFEKEELLRELSEGHHRPVKG